MNKPYYVLLLSSVVGILLSGCIANDHTINERHIWQIVMEMTTDSNETSKINETYVAGELQSMGYTVNVYGKNNPQGADQGIHGNKNKTDIALFVSTDTNNPYLYYYWQNFDNNNESQLANRKENVKDEVTRIATICNLTIDWSKAQWTISYAD